MTDSDAIDRYHRLFTDVLSRGWKAAFEDIRTTFNHPDHDAAFMSHALQMRAVVHCKGPLINNFGAKHLHDQNQHIFTIPDVVHIVFNQLDENLLRGRSRTRRHGLFFSQASLPGLPDLPRWISGAVPDPHWSQLIGVYVTHPHSRGRKNNWAIDITADPVSVDADQVRLDLSQPDDKPRPRQNPYRRKDDKRAHEDDQDGESSAGVSG
jgi:hypothetical protein